MAESMCAENHRPEKEREKPPNNGTKATKEGSLCFRFVSFLHFAFDVLDFMIPLQSILSFVASFIHRYFVGFWISLLREFPIPQRSALQFTVASLRESLGRAAVAAKKTINNFSISFTARTRQINNSNGASNRWNASDSIDGNGRGRLCVLHSQLFETIWGFPLPSLRSHFIPKHFRCS